MSASNAQETQDVASRFRHDLRNHIYQLNMALGFAAAARESRAAAQWLELVVRETDACIRTLDAFANWPDDDPEPPGQTPTAVPGGAARLPGRLRVLVVGDAGVSGSTLARLLELEGYSARCATSAAEAWEWVAQGRFHLMVCDLDVGGVRDLVSKVGAVHGTYGIALTAPEERGPEAAGGANGFSRHLDKPVSFDDLLAVVRDLIG